MHQAIGLMVAVLVLAACGSDTQVAPVVDPVSGGSVASSSRPETAPPAVAFDSDVAPRESTEGPAYDVFLAAVADTLVGTRFDGLPYEEAELFAATGLVLCERMEAGLGADDVVYEYLSEITDADPASADDDQLVLAGALIGASEAALCPKIPTG